MKRLDDKVFKGLIILVIVMALTAVLARTMKGSETLADYARNHPDEQVTVEIIQVTEDEEVGQAIEYATGDTRDKDGEIADDNSVINSSEDIASLENENFGSEENESGADDEYADTDERVIYKEGFYYEPVPEQVRLRMQGKSYPEDIDESRVSFKDLRYCRLKYVDFNGNSSDGEMICNISIADDVMEIFYELYLAEYRIESIKLIDEYDADDTLSMTANNTSCFCYRVVDGSTNLSNHAYGKAIDLNPFYNPYVVFKTGEDDYISPPGSEIYADRSQNFPYKIDENDLAYRLFKEHGFRWGGDWNSCKDYQHFDKK